jgi:epoxyqueuosine reductase
MNFGFEYGVVDIRDYLRHRPLKGRDWIKSILVFVFPYAGKAPEVDGYLTAKYAYGKDYHAVIKDKLEEIARKLGLKRYEALADVSYLDEKLCAVLAGLGKIGKNNLLLTPKYGSRVLIGEIATDADFPKTEKVVPDPCVGCFLCVRKCPTGALRNGFDKKRCLSYLSQKAGGDFELYEKMELVVGCDVCQDVCPLNRQEQAFPEEFRFDWKSRFTLEEFLEIGEEGFKEHYQDKAFCFLGYKKILRNLLVLEANKNSLALADLKRFENDSEVWFKKHIDYLKGRISGGKD